MTKTENQSQKLFVSKIDPSIEISIVTLESVCKHLKTNDDTSVEKIKQLIIVAMVEMGIAFLIRSKSFFSFR